MKKPGSCSFQRPAEEKNLHNIHAPICAIIVIAPKIMRNLSILSQPLIQQIRQDTERITNRKIPKANVTGLPRRRRSLLSMARHPSGRP